MIWIQSALAQVTPQEPLDIERFKPAITHDGFVVVEGTAVREALPDDPLALGLLLNGSLNPLVVVDGQGDVAHRFVSSRVAGDLLVSATIAGPFALGLGLPFFVSQAGDFDPNPSGIGDLRLLPKLRLTDDRRAPLGLALLAEVRAPTHSDEEFSGGARGALFAPRVALDHRFPLGLRIGANGGVLLRPPSNFGNVEAASELTYAGAVSIHPGGHGGKAAIGAEVHGGAGLSGIDFEELPLEGQLYGSFRPRPDLEILGGPAWGLVPGYGTPTFRFFLGIRYAPTANDEDWDGIADRDDKCPSKAETRNRIDDLDGCPDDDGQFPAVVVALGPDGAPIEGAPVTITVNDEARTGKSGSPEQLPPGRYPVTVEATGYQPRQAVLVVTPEGKNRVDVKLTPVPGPGTVSVTILGPDGDPLKKAEARVDDDKAAAGPTPGTVQVEVAAGEHVLWVRSKGYVPQRIEIEVLPGREVAKTVTLQKIEIELTDDQLKLSGTVYFDTGSARIVSESNDLLDEVALTMIATPSIRKLRVEGHTDSQGPEDFNQKLSEDRARAVVAYLVAQGVPADRLEAQGFGETRPISDDMDQNRRVDFVIVKGSVGE